MRYVIRAICAVVKRQLTWVCERSSVVEKFSVFEVLGDALQHGQRLVEVDLK